MGEETPPKVENSDEKSEEDDGCGWFALGVLVVAVVIVAAAAALG